MKELGSLQYKMGQYATAEETMKLSQEMLVNSHSLNQNPLLRAWLIEAECLLMKKKYSDAEEIVEGVLKDVISFNEGKVLKVQSYILLGVLKLIQS